jgi:hypothetical protein
VDRVLAGLAGRREGMVSHEQLLAGGLGRGAIELRLRNGRLHPYHRGVYSVGHTRLTPRARLWAAVLACGGPGASLLGFRGAAAPWDLMPMPSGAVDVITLRRSCSRKGIRVHKTGTLEPQDVTDIDGLPLTTPTRTLSTSPTNSPHTASSASCTAPSTCASSTSTPSTPDSPSYPAAVPDPCSKRWRPWNAGPTSRAANSKNASWRW